MVLQPRENARVFRL
jgi:hypothetical protein